MVGGSGGGLVPIHQPFMHAVPKGQGGLSTPHCCAFISPMNVSLEDMSIDNSIDIKKKQNTQMNDFDIPSNTVYEQQWRGHANVESC